MIYLIKTNQMVPPKVDFPDPVLVASSTDIFSYIHIQMLLSIPVQDTQSKKDLREKGK